jgi:hypothetical protein
MKVAFQVIPASQNPERLIKIRKNPNIEEEIKKYMVSPNLLFTYRIASDDETTMIKNTKYGL